MTDKCGRITLLDVSKKPFVPLTIILEDRGLETVECLVGKVEKILSKIASDQPNADYLMKFKVRVTKLVVGDLEIKRENWLERNVDHYRILDDPWFILTTRAPDLPDGETVVTTLVYNSPIQRSISVCSGVESMISCVSGVVEFTDFAPSGLQRRTWSSSAPKWRRANPGLCVEGKCSNEKCEANGNMVIINMGFNDFILPHDTYKCKCPLCDKQVQPVTCGFNNCRWKWGGIRLEFSNPPTTHKEKEWQVADDAYHLFNPKGAGDGKAQWIHILIVTEPSTQEPIVCSLCLKKGTADIKVYKCGHKLHKVCFLNYPQHPNEDTTSVCPQCFMLDLSDKQT